MSKFYLTDPNINTLPLNDLQFRIYHYCCANYNVKKLQAFIRIVNIGGQFQLTKDEVQQELINLSEIKHLDLPLIKITKENYISFDMPSHKKFLESIGFKKFSNYGWKVLNGHLKQIHTKELNKTYLYPRLDQYELYDQLEDLPTEELNKIKKEDLQYPWVLKNVIKNRA
jgi:hypothetical protein